MSMQEICPCPNLNCPNHGHCDDCTSRHVRIGYLNYCSFQTLVPAMQQVIDADPESASSKMLDGLIKAQNQVYEKLMDEHGLTWEGQNKLLKKVADYSKH